MNLFSNLKGYTLVNALVSITILMVASYFLFSDGLAVDATRSTKALWNLGHVAYFALLTVIFLKTNLLKSSSYLKCCLWVIIGAISIGILIEILQYGTKREPDLYDVGRDLLGSLIILAFYHPAPNTIKTFQLFFKTIVLTFVLISLWPLSIALWDENNARSQFPILSDFSSPLEINRWSGEAHISIQSATKDHPNHLNIQFGTQKYSGLDLAYFGHDWSPYKNLVLNVYNPSSKTLSLTLRIHDKKHINSNEYSDRFNQLLKIAPGFNTVKIPIKDIKTAPLNRLMDLNQIINMKIFSINFPKPETLYLYKVFLSD